jgi:hypothetical protein
LALAAYKKEESNPGFLDTHYTYTASADRTSTSTVLVDGQSYSVREIIAAMLTASDNASRDLLTKSINNDDVALVYKYLGVSEPVALDEYKVSLADYALLFRMLYSSTFLNEAHSEEVLKVLTKTTFSAGITRYLPSKYVVAHKFGVFNIPPDANGVSLQQLHDCGIVYEADEPYIICMMTKGLNQKVLSDFISTVSKTIFDWKQEN